MPTPSDKQAFPKTITLTVETPTQELAARQALLLAQELEATTAAASGSLLQAFEETATAGGRELTRALLQRSVQERIDELEKKGARCAAAGAGAGASAKGRTARRS